jgi:hypothetical protein
MDIRLLIITLAASLTGCPGGPPKTSQQPDAPVDTPVVIDAPGSTDIQTVPDAPAQVVGACDSLAPVGTWQEITPPAVKAGLANKMPSDAGGTFAFAVDTVNSGTLYVGTVYQKMWKSTDCGSTWAPVGTGRHAGSWDHAMNWTFAVDPKDPTIVYTNSGYGTMFRVAQIGQRWGRLGHHLAASAATRSVGALSIQFRQRGDH